MAINTSAVTNTAAAYQTGDPSGVSSKKNEYGRTIGEPKLSDEGKKYYDELKKKFGGYDFILVSKDQIESARSQAARYANPNKPVVLIDEDKIDKSVPDREYKYGGTGFESEEHSCLEYMQKLFARNKK